jgi:hypothetical protein
MTQSAERNSPVENELRKPSLFGTKWALRFGAVAVAGAAGAGFYFRNDIQAAWLVRQVSQTTEAEAPQHIERAKGIGDSAIAPMASLFQSDRDLVVKTAMEALLGISANWAQDDSRRVILAGKLSQGFVGFSPQGQAASLNLVSAWLAEPPVAGSPLMQAVAGLLAQAALGMADPAPGTEADPTVPKAALVLLARIPAATASAEASRREDALARRDLLRQILRKGDPASRVEAISVIMRTQTDLYEDLVARLEDPVAEVRRACILAIGPANEKVREDVLLSALHDNDSEVGRLAELALSARGLSTEHIRLGKLLTDPDPARRLEVLDLVQGSPDLDEKLWLERMSHDRADSVRAAAARALSARFGIDAQDRLKQMAGSDPSPSVSRIAGFYLGQQGRGNTAIVPR